MEKQQFDLLMGTIKDVKTDIRQDIGALREEQVSQGKSLAKVCDKVKTHSWIHRTTGLAFIGLFVTWVKSKFA